MRLDDDPLELFLIAHEETRSSDVMIGGGDRGGACARDAVGKKLQRIGLPVRTALRRQLSRQGFLWIEPMHESEPDQRSVGADQIPDRIFLVKAAGEADGGLDRRRQSKAPCLRYP